MPKVSLIVPVYNVEKYLRKCIDSILNQTFTDFELILVNDGSLDSSGDICEEYKRRDNRIKVINKKNGGLSEARNFGIDIAIGEYIGFIDSDDYIEKNMIEILYKSIVENDSDIAICGYYIDFDKINIKNNNIEKNLVLTSQQAIEIIPDISPAAWNKLYKRNIFEKIRYPIGKFNEDVYILLDILEKANKISYCKERLYHYIQRSNSITKSEFNDKKWDCVFAWEKNLNIVRERYENAIKAVEYKYFGSYIYLLDSIIITPKYKNNNNYIKIKKFINNNIKHILKNPFIKLKRKISLIAFMIYPDIYKIIVLRLNKKRWV